MRLILVLREHVSQSIAYVASRHFHAVSGRKSTADSIISVLYTESGKKASPLFIIADSVSSQRQLFAVLLGIQANCTETIRGLSFGLKVVVIRHEVQTVSRPSVGSEDKL